MANYSLVSNAQFRPFTFQEMSAPLEMYRQYYRENEELANALAEQAADIGSRLNEVTDKKSYEKYRNYADKLAEYSEQMMRGGMTPTLRSDIQKMRRMYSSEITPIKNAYDWRLKQIEAQQAGKAKGLMYEQDAASTSLDEYIKNPNLIHESIDPTVGMNRVASQASVFAKKLRKAQVDGKFDDYTSRILIKYGYDPEDVQGTIDKFFNDFNSITSGQKPSQQGENFLYDILAGELEGSGISNWSADKQREYMNKVAPALYQAVGQESATQLADVAARQRISENMAWNDYLRKQSLPYRQYGLHYNSKGDLVKTVGGKEVLATEEEISNARIGISSTSSGSYNVDLSKSPVVDKKLAGRVDLSNGFYVDKQGVRQTIPNVPELIEGIAPYINNGITAITEVSGKPGVYEITLLNGSKQKIDTVLPAAIEVNQKGRDLITDLRTLGSIHGDYTFSASDLTMESGNAKFGSSDIRTDEEAIKHGFTYEGETNTRRFLSNNAEALGLKDVGGEQIDNLAKHVKLYTKKRGGITDDEYLLIQSKSTDIDDLAD